MMVDGQPIDGLTVRLGPEDIVFGISCDGRIDIVDGLGETQALQADGWPLPGRDNTGPVLHRLR
jgi:hypothetical protein